MVTSVHSGGILVPSSSGKPLHGECNAPGIGRAPAPGDVPVRANKVAGSVRGAVAGEHPSLRVANIPAVPCYPNLPRRAARDLHGCGAEDKQGRPGTDPVEQVAVPCKLDIRCQGADSGPGAKAGIVVVGSRQRAVGVVMGT